MLIIPVENKPDWRHPPVVTLLVMLVNVWVYFAFVATDEEALAGAFHSYVASRLIEREAYLFRDYRRGICLPTPQTWRHGISTCSC